MLSLGWLVLPATFDYASNTGTVLTLWAIGIIAAAAALASLGCQTSGNAQGTRIGLLAMALAAGAQTAFYAEHAAALGATGLTTAVAGLGTICAIAAAGLLNPHRPPTPVRYLPEPSGSRWWTVPIWLGALILALGQLSLLEHSVTASATVFCYVLGTTAPWVAAEVVGPRRTNPAAIRAAAAWLGLLLPPAVAEAATARTAADVGSSTASIAALVSLTALLSYWSRPSRRQPPTGRQDTRP
jgi:hypothetical protein